MPCQVALPAQRTCPIIEGIRHYAAPYLSGSTMRMKSRDPRKILLQVQLKIGSHMWQQPDWTA